MIRREDWPERLEEYINDVQDVEFDWDNNNCLIFSMGAVEAVTGENLYQEYREKHATESTETLFEELGVIGVYRMLRSAFGNSIPVSMAQRGDLIIRRKPYSIGICRGALSNFVGVDEDYEGVIEVETLKAAYAFKVGR